MVKVYTLITGATGFIGSHVAERLLQDGTWPVITIVRGGRGYKNTARLEKKGAILVRGRFYDPDLLNTIFEKFPIRNVIHVAALTGDGKGSRNDYDEVNVRGTETLLAISHRHDVDKFVHCSSAGVFGTIPPEVPADLGTRLSPDNLYHHSKLTAEERTQDFINRDLNAFIIRPTIAYGLRDRGFPFRLVKMIRRKVLLLPVPDNRIHLVSAGSLAEMFVRILKADRLHNRVFIAADEGPVVLRELADLIYSFYFGRNYPQFLKMSNAVFDIFENMFRIAHSTQWTGRIERISKDWFFNTRETDALIGFHPANTQKEFLRYLRSLK
ncbi:MAG: NAD(P)-dependent oxidoreductase [Deltaproteobacteria bacterium]|nr:NAD(P)-dependent oxidoreductase [Deltaproteobacteria bacterium]